MNVHQEICQKTLKTMEEICEKTLEIINDEIDLLKAYDIKQDFAIQCFYVLGMLDVLHKASIISYNDYARLTSELECEWERCKETIKALY